MWSRVATKKSNLSIENTIVKYGKFIVIFYVKFIKYQPTELTGIVIEYF